MNTSKNKAPSFSIIIVLLPILLLAGCVAIPDGIKPVTEFKLDRYLGEWHEIARLDHRFERGLSRVTANYSLRDDGGVKVINRGYSERDKVWKQVEGKAYFVGQPDQGYLKVSFFGPFYGSYVVFNLDHQNYQHALVCGPNRSYLWILAKTPSIETGLKDKLVTKAKDLGFDTDKLIFVDNSAPQK